MSYVRREDVVGRTILAFWQSEPEIEVGDEHAGLSGEQTFFRLFAELDNDTFLEIGTHQDGYPLKIHSDGGNLTPFCDIDIEKLGALPATIREVLVTPIDHGIFLLLSSDVLVWVVDDIFGTEICAESRTLFLTSRPWGTELRTYWGGDRWNWSP